MNSTHELRMVRSGSVGSFIAALLLGASVAQGHDTWMLPKTHAIPAGTEIALQATSGMNFPAVDHGLVPNRIEVARIRVGGRSSPIHELRGGKDALLLLVTPEREGVATLWLESKSKAIDLKPDEVREYLEEIGAPASVEEIWRAAGSRWHETYVKHAKTFVRVGERIDTDRSWSEPVGMRLEIVPDSDPTRLKTGAPFSVTVLREGRPAHGLSVGFVEAGVKKPTLRKTDAGGRVSFTSKASGWALIRATNLHPAGSIKGDWKSDFSTLTVWVESPN